jgi:hypothetical protein
VDEVHEIARSVRSGRYLYIRNYHPYLSHNQPSVFPDLGEIRREITRLAATKPTSLTKAQLDYAGPSKPVEAFYDCDGDTLLFTVEQEGRGACHTGEFSCFFRSFGAGLPAS